MLFASKTEYEKFVANMLQLSVKQRHMYYFRFSKKIYWFQYIAK